MAQDLFAPAALFITFRETVEAAIIIAVLLSFLKKTNNMHLKRQVLAGVAFGVILSVILGIAFMAAYYSAKSVIFESHDQHIFEGSVSVVASAFISFVALAMLRMYSMQVKWESRLRKSTESLEMSGRNRYALFILAFSAVFREGVETVLLITGISRGNPESLPIPGLLGIFIGVIFGYLVAFGSRPINLKVFMMFNSFLLFAIGDGIFIYGMHAFQEEGFFGEWNRRGPGGVTIFLRSKDRPWLNQYLADFSACCNSDKPAVDGNGQKPTFFTLLRAIFGYQAKPTRLEIICYCAYWGLVILVVGYKLSKGTLWGVKAKLEREAAQDKLAEGDEEGGGAWAKDGEVPVEAPKAEKEELLSSPAARLLTYLLNITAPRQQTQAQAAAPAEEAAESVQREEVLVVASPQSHR